MKMQHWWNDDTQGKFFEVFDEKHVILVSTRIDKSRID